MAIEYEVKILEIDEDKVRSKLKASFGEPEIQNFRRYIFDTIPEKPNQWIRLRTDGTKTTLAFKHAKEDSISGVEEVEVDVSNFDDTYQLLANLGLEYRNYEENNRELYQNDEVEVSIDTWPKIPPYVEVEAKDEATVKKYIKLLGFDENQQTSMTTGQLFEKYGLNIEDGKELRF